ncbi:MAG: Rha family transcriptional regulator [Cyanobacteria bacterium P01_A01_bin.17]
MAETNITVQSRDGLLVVDSRLIAERLGLEHSAWITNIVKKYQAQAEQAFGILHFENGKIDGRGRPKVFIYLTEDQATFFMTLSRNTPEVIQCKIDLVKAFSAAKKTLSTTSASQPFDRSILPAADVRIANLNAALVGLGIQTDSPEYLMIKDLVFSKILDRPSGFTQSAKAPALAGSTEVWLSVAEKARQLGYPTRVIKRYRSSLGRFVQTEAGWAGIQCREELRWSNGVMKHKAYLYLDSDILSEIVKSYMEAKLETVEVA